MTLNLRKSCYVIVSRRTLDTFNFNVFINHNKIEKLREILWCLSRSQISQEKSNAPSL